MSNLDHNGVCCICGRETLNIHMHHTVPRSLGGDNSLLIPLDGDCHTKLHAHASALVARVNGNRKKPVTNPWTPDEEVNAEQWITILVQAMLNPPNMEDKTTLLPSLRVDGEIRGALEILKRDYNLKNLETTLMYCIRTTLIENGILENEQAKRNSSNHCKKSTLRRLQRSKLGETGQSRRHLQFLGQSKNR